MDNRCQDCGFDASSVSPSDAEVALRSFPRRYREVLPADDAPDRDEVWAEVMTNAAQAAGAIADLSADVQAVFVQDDAWLSTTDNVATAVRHPGELVTAIDRLAAAAIGLADLASAHHGTEWSRTGARSSGPVSALDLLRDAVHAGVHHLRAITG